MSQEKKNIIQEMQDVLDAANQFNDLDKDVETSKFVDKKTNKEYESIEQAFRSGLTDFSSFEEKKEKINPKSKLSKMVNNDVISGKDIEIAQSFLKLLKELDNDANYNKQYRNLMNYKSRAKKEGDDEKVKKLEKEINELNEKFGRTTRTRKKE